MHTSDEIGRATSPRRTFPASSGNGMVHVPASSLHSARRSTRRASSGGTKLVIMRSFNFNWRLSWRMASSRSSRSPWNSAWMSATSACAAWYLPQSFLSLRVFTSTSSCGRHRGNVTSSCIFIFLVFTSTASCRVEEAT
eukprot:NODE_1116_length_2138_cov_0.027464.p2 type:complete len:139 gc:universal NODE_1116_length_2138_cov_0.027464:906-490(-)